MSPSLLLRALVALPVFAVALPAQDSTATRGSVQPSSVALAPVGARRDTSRVDSLASARASRSATRSGDDQISAMLFTLGAAAIGGTAGALFKDPCFGDGGEMAAQALVAGFAIGIPFSVVVTHFADDTGASAPASPTRPTSPGAGALVREALALPAGGAALGALLGAPIGAVQGASHPARCGGSALSGMARGTAQMAVGGAVVGAGVATIAGISTLVEWMGEGRQNEQDRIDALARGAGIRADTLRGQKSPRMSALVSVVLPGAGHIAVGEMRRGLLFSALTYGTAALAANSAPAACFEEPVPAGSCTRAEQARMTAGVVATGLMWALTAADSYWAAERHNRRVVEQAVERAKSAR